MAIWAILLYRKQEKIVWLGSSKAQFTLLALWFLAVLLDGFRTDSSAWLNEVLLKLPLILAPIYFVQLNRKSRDMELSLILLVGFASLTAAVSTINYWLNYEEINRLLLQSKHVPIYGNMHHIYFGVYMAVSVWISWYYLKRGSYNRLWIVLGVVLLMCMHILSSRTGLVAFYISAIVYMAFEAYQRKRWKLLIGGLLMVGLMPVIGMQVSTSLRNKVLNSLEDFEAVRSGENINYKSLAMRVEAWKTTVNVIKAQHLRGVSAVNLENELQRQYVRDETVLYRENRVGPHNQFLEVSAAHGLVLGVILLLFMIYWIKDTQGDPWKLALVVLILVTLLLESLVERQQGLILFVLCSFALNHLPSSKVIETES